VSFLRQGLSGWDRFGGAIRLAMLRRARERRRTLALDFSRNSLVGRLIWLAAGWSIAVLAVTCVAATALFYGAAIDRFDLGLKDMADGLLAGASVDPSGAVAAPPLTDARALRVYSGKYWELAEVGPDGRLHQLARSRSLWDSDLAQPPDGRQLRLGSDVHYDSRGPQGEPLHVIAETRTLPGRKAPVVFMVAEDRSPVDRDVILQVRVGLKPLFDLRREVTDVRKGRSERVAGSYPAELEPLAKELNALVAHNQEVVERQRTHVGNLAHALKTPLSVMTTEASSSKGPLAELVQRQAHAMRLQVDHHLRRARAAARAQGSRDRTMVAPALEELARTLERIFEGRGVVIEQSAPEDLAFQGERQDLLEVAGNVMENACKWCRGMVWASAESLPDDRMRLTIEDDGAGLPPERREEVFKRGARLDESAPGSGLGLSIVEELVRAYGGSISLDRSPRGGLLVQIELPRA
jgi:signal transduction histidine kinase